MNNKYAEGYPGRRYYGGCQIVDQVEALAIERCKELFRAEHANVQPHSGTQANMAVYYATLEPGDLLMGMNLAHGGHLTHGSSASFSGRIYRSVPYGVSPQTETIDYDELLRLALAHRPKLIVAGASAYPRQIDFSAFRDIADEVGAYLMVDMAHFAGLVATGIYPSPVPLADFVTSTTHKTLRGPRGGFILCKQQFAKSVDSAIIPGIQGGPLEHVIAAKAVCFLEANSPSFQRYQVQVMANARAFAAAMMNRGYRLVSNGTDSHLFLVDLRAKGLTGKQAEEALDSVGISVNKNSIPFDPLGPRVTSGIRIGTPAVTSRGMKEQEMEQISRVIDAVLAQPTDQGVLAWAKDQTRAITRQFPLRANE